MPDLVPIGRFAALSGLTVKALRHYDKRGVLRPALVDFATGRRYYSRDQVGVTARFDPEVVHLKEYPIEGDGSALDHGSMPDPPPPSADAQ